MTNLLSEIYAAVLPLLLSVLAAWLAKVLASAANEAKRRWGIEIEARHREALHSALMSGIRAALNRGLTGQAAISSAVTYANQSVPDALARLRPDAKVLARLAASKLREVHESSAYLGLDYGQPEGDPQK